MNSHSTHLSPQTARVVGNDLRREAWSRMKPRRNSFQRGCRRGRAPGLLSLPLFNRAAVESPGRLNVDGIRRGCPREVEEGDEASERIVVRSTPATSNAEPSPSSLEKLHHS